MTGFWGGQSASASAGAGAGVWFLGITFIVILRIFHPVIPVRCSMVSIPGYFEAVKFLITGRISQAPIRNVARE